MTLLVEAGSMVITDDTVSGSPTVFDSDERLFHVTNGPITGSITAPQRVAVRTITSTSNTHSFVDVDTATAMVSVHALATTVRGQFFASVSGTQFGVSNLGWFDASGTYVHYLGPNNAALGGAGNVSMPNIAAYTFYVSGGVLYFHERCRIDAPRSVSNGTYTRTLPGVTLQYSLYVGTFT